MGLQWDYDSDADGPKVFHLKTLKAKVNHRCTECKGIIEAGESYERATGIWDIRWETFRKCERCMAYESAMEQHYRGFMHGNDFGSLFDEVRPTMRDLYSVDHPGRWFGVARKLVAVRQRYDKQAHSGVTDKSGRGVPERQLFWQRRRHINYLRGMDLSESEIRIASTMEQS